MPSSVIAWLLSSFLFSLPTVPPAIRMTLPSGTHIFHPSKMEYKNIKIYHTWWLSEENHPEPWSQTYLSNDINPIYLTLKFLWILVSQSPYGNIALQSNWIKRWNYSTYIFNCTSFDKIGWCQKSLLSWINGKYVFNTNYISPEEICWCNRILKKKILFGLNYESQLH